MESRYKVKEQVWASKGSRFANFLVDRVLVTGVVFCLAALLGLLLDVTESYELLNSMANINPILDSLITLLFYVLYFIVLEGKYQISIGKLMTKTIVVDEYGNPPSMNAIVKRSFSRLIPFEFFSFLGEDSYGWHDSISKTYVVDKKLLEQKKILFNDLNRIGEE